MIHTIIGGNVTADARLMENGSCMFTIAHNERAYTNKDGAQIPEETTYYTVFKSNGENLVNHIKKGMYMMAFTNKPTKCTIYEGKVQQSINAVSVEFGGK